MALPALALVAVLLAAIVSIDPSVLCILPALALALLLSLRRYPGERVLVALARSRRHEPRWQNSIRAEAPSPLDRGPPFRAAGSCSPARWRTARRRSHCSRRPEQPRQGRASVACPAGLGRP